MFNTKKRYNEIVIVKRNDNYHSKKIKDLCSFLETYAETSGIQYSLFDNKINYTKNKVLFISLGGDGTMIYTSHQAAKCKESGVFGLNVGNLGFLTETFNGYSELSNILDAIINSSNNVICDTRKILKGNLIATRKTQESYALNEFVISAGDLNHPSLYEIFINDKLVAKQFGSGIVVGSATGSTALSLSAGGAIISPTTDVMQVVPIAAHTLSSRPIITSIDDVIKVSIKQNERLDQYQISADGSIIENIPNPMFDLWSENGQLDFEITVSTKQVDIWRPLEWNFFDVLSQKMNW